MMILVGIHQAEDHGAFVELLQSSGYIFREYTSIPKLFAVTTSIEDFTLGNHPIVNSVEKDEELELKPMSTDIQLPNVEFRYTWGGDTTADSWALPRMCRRKNPFGVPPRTFQSASSFYRHTRTGVGVDVYVLDSGMQIDHPDFAGRVTPLNGEPVNDITGSMHALMVVSCVTGTTCGLATGAHVFYQKMVSNLLTELAADYDDVITHYNSRAGTNRPAVLNQSISASVSTPNAAYVLAIGAVIDAGILCCFPAGNYSEDHDVVYQVPAETDSDALIVGATAVNDGPMWQNYFGTGSSSEVDLYSPGHNIRAANDFDIFKTTSGTSFASPYVAGIAACMLEGYTRLTSRAEVLALKAKIIANTTKDVLDFPDTFGLNFVNNRLAYLDPEVHIEHIEGLTKL